MLRSLAVFLVFTISKASDIPIVGVLTQETNNNKTEGYIAASYVKFVESAGVRVVPVWIGQNQSYYEKIVNYTNGLLFPGGDVFFNETGGYGEAATILYNLAVAANDRGLYYPVWGTCLGLEVFMYILAQKYITVECSMNNIALPLQLTAGIITSRLFQNSSEITFILAHENLTFNEHSACLTEDALNENNIEDWNILATNRDHNYNLTFISAMENTKYPFYAIQFHPEKNVFEFRENTGIPHTENAVKASQYFANFLGSESRKNENTFPSQDLEARSLIYNYSPTYTGISDNPYFEQKYFFTEADVNTSALVTYII